MKNSHDAIIKARLSLQRALLGEIPPALRACIFSIYNLNIDIRFYFDGAISEKDEESISCVESEVLADYDPEYVISARCIRLDTPAIINDDGIWVYSRRE